jgi:hypothetical protein
MPKINVKNDTAPGTPPTGYTSIYAKTDKFIYIKDDAGNEYNITAQPASAAPVTQTPDQANTEGVALTYSKSDHIHNIPADTAVGLDPSSTSTEGVASSFSRSDHTHAIATALAASITTIQPDASASAGVANNFARGDHQHAIVADAAVTLDASSTNTEGNATSFARSNHTHAISTGTPSTQNPDQSNATGTSANLARADHIHNIPTDTAVSVSTSTSNAQGNATTFARSNHTHAVSLSSSTASATASTTTTSTTPVLLDSMTLTPAAGTYLVSFGTSTVNSGNGALRNFFILSVGGSTIAATNRSTGVAGSSYSVVSIGYPVTVNGSQAIEIYWSVLAGTGTALERTLSIVKIA